MTPCVNCAQRNFSGPRSSRITHTLNATSARPRFKPYSRGCAIVLFLCVCDFVLFVPLFLFSQKIIKRNTVTEYFT